MKRIILGTTLFVILLLGVIFSTNTKTQYVTNEDSCLISKSSESIIPVQECAITQECMVTDNNKKFQLGEYEGNLAVFKSGNPIPIKITSTMINELPDTDQQLLKNRIEASCEEEINILLEDYCS